MSAHSSKCEEPDISPLWASPEALRGEPQTERSDAYSFATVLWECLSGTLPFERPLWDVYAAVLGGERPDMSKVRWTDGLQDGELAARLEALMRDGWSDDAARRPTLLEYLSLIHI